MGNKGKWDVYSDKELLQMIKDLSVRNNKTPSKNDLGVKNNLPSATYYYKRFNMTWNELLQKIGLILNHQEGYTKQDIINKTKILYNELNRIPTKTDFKNSNLLPSVHILYNFYNSWDEALFEAKLIPKILSSEQKKQLIIHKLVQLGNTIESVPTYEEIKKYLSKFEIYFDFYKSFKMTYNELCEKYLPQYNLNRKYQYPTKQQLIENMNDIVLSLGRVPGVRELNSNVGISKYSYNCYKRMFKENNYIKILKQLGFEYIIESSIKKDDERLLSDFEKLFKNLKRVPYWKDIDKNKNIASSSIYKKRFGNIQNICDLLDIDYTQYYRKSGAGVVCYDKNKGLCKSEPEMLITNYFIDNNIKYTKEYWYKKLGFNDNRRFDWMIEYNNKKYYIEFFGMYRNKTQRVNQKYIKKSKKKIKDLYKAGLIKQCVFIFPKDIKCNKFEGLTEKLSSFFMSNFNINIHNLSNDKEYKNLEEAV